MELLNVGRYKEKLARRRLDPRNYPIRPQNKKTRLWIDNEYFSRGYAANFSNLVTLAYFVLAKYANAKNQTCFPSINLIMKEVGVKNRNSIISAIKTLEAHGIIEVARSKGRTSNQYILLRTEAWKPANGIKNDTVPITK